MCTLFSWESVMCSLLLGVCHVLSSPGSLSLLSAVAADNLAGRLAIDLCGRGMAVSVQSQPYKQLQYTTALIPPSPFTCNGRPT